RLHCIHLITLHSVFIFLETPLPAHTYTLSLHDALPIFRCIPHPSATRHPESKLSCAAVRLACVRPTASVHSEPGSNSSLKTAKPEGLKLLAAEVLPSYESLA